MTSSFDHKSQKPEAGCILHLSATIMVFGRGEDHKTWEIQKVTEEQKEGDAAPRTYLKLKSIDHYDCLRFITVPYDPAIMRVFPAPDTSVQPKAIFPEPGSQVVIEEPDDSGSFTSFRNGLWQVDKAKYIPRQFGGGQELQLQLSSINRKHPAFMNVVFNKFSMKPVPFKVSEAELANMQVDRDVPVSKPLNIRKRNAAP